MKLTTADVSEFQSLYKKHFGLQLDRKTARAQLYKLVQMMEAVYQPITLKQLERLAEKDMQKAEEELK